MNWTIDNVDGAYLVVSMFGRYTLEGQHAMESEIFSTSFWRPGMPAIFDQRQLDFSGINYELIQQVGAGHEKNDHLIGESKTAIVVESNVGYGLARQFEITVDGVVGAEIRVFRSFEEAEAWIKPGL